MRSRHRPFLLILAGGCLLLPLSCPAPLTAYLKIEDIKGESRESGHEDWITIESIVDGGIRLEAGDGHATGRREHRPLTIIKPLDKASPLLMDTLTKSAILETVTLEATEPFPRSDGAPEDVVYFRYKMTEARVISYGLRADPEGDRDQPLKERVQFTFPYAEWHVRQLAGDGALVDSAGAFFDVEQNSSGPATIGPVIEQAGNIEVSAGEDFIVDVQIQDFDTPHTDLIIEPDTDGAIVKVGSVQWAEPDLLRISLSTTSAARGQVPFTLHASDGENDASMSFSIFVDSTGTPWDGFLKAYFTEEERADPTVSSPIEDPDGDDLATLLEFLLGTNPREYSYLEVNPDPESPGRLKVFFPSHLDPDDDGDSIGLVFDRRIDDPRIHLRLLASFDGGASWQSLESSDGDNPLYQESTSEVENPLYEGVSGTVNPTEEATATLLRFVGVMQ